MLLKINLQIQDLKKKQATLAALQEQAEETMRATQVDLRIKFQLGDGKALLFRGKGVLLKSSGVPHQEDFVYTNRHPKWLRSL